MASTGAKDQADAATSGAGRFLVLDGMRGIAAFAVILDHVSSPSLQIWFPGRYLAVDFFFVLSGFVLAHAYGKKLEQGTLSPIGFMHIRLIRLYPLYLLGLVLGVVLPVLAALRGWTGASPLPEIATAAAIGVLFLPAPNYAWTGGQLYPFNGPSWSLFFELVVNLIYGFIAKYLTWLVLGVVLVVAAGLLAFTVTRHSDLGPGWLWPHFDAGLSRVTYCFFAGVAIYKLRDVVKFPAIPAWAAVLALIAAFAVPAPGGLRPAFDVFAAIMLMPALVAVASGAKVSGIAARVCGTLGVLSYGVYALHVPVLYLLRFVMQAAGVSLPYDFMEVFVVAVAAGLVAAAATRFYDSPLRKLLSGRAKQAGKPAIASESG